MDRDKGWVTKKHAAEFLGKVSMRTLERWIARGWLRVVRVGGVVRVPMDAVRAFQKVVDAGGFADAA